MNTNTVPLDNCSGYGLFNLLKDKENLLGLEIGCYLGDTTNFLLKNIQTLKLYGIDPYETYIDWNGNTINRNSDTYVRFIEKVKHFEDRFKLFRKTSDEAVKDFEDGLFDFIFVDGLHTYDQVKTDIENYYPKLKTGGLFSGHDYNSILEVKKAVDEFALTSKITNIQFTDFDVWYWYKV